MLGLLKNLFSQPDDKALTEAIRNGAFLVDVRTPGEFASGSVAGAVNIPLDRIASRLDELKNSRTQRLLQRTRWRHLGACSLSERQSVITKSEKDFDRYNSFSIKKDWFLNFCLSEDKNIIIKPILFYII